MTPPERTGVPSANNMHLYTCPVMMSLIHEQLSKHLPTTFRHVTNNGHPLSYTSRPLKSDLNYVPVGQKYPTRTARWESKLCHCNLTQLASTMST